MSGNKKSIFYSIRTKLSLVMLAGAIIPLLVAVTVSYNFATEKATKDAIDSLQWQAKYMQSEFEGVVNDNLRTIQAVASAPSTIHYMQEPENQTYIDEELAFLASIDENLYDGSTTVITGADGMQLLANKDRLNDVSDREYFVQAMSGKTYVSDVMISRSTGNRLITFSTPIYIEGNVVGIVQRNYDLNNFHLILAQEAEDAFLVDRKGYVVASSMFAITPDDEIDMSGCEFMVSGKNEGVYAEGLKNNKTVVCYVKSDLTGFTICSFNNCKAITAAARQSSTIILIYGAVMALCTAFLAFLLAKSFTNPITAISRAFSEMAGGYMAKIDKYCDRKDEFGQMINDSNAVLDRLGSIFESIKNSAEEVERNADEISDMAQRISDNANELPAATVKEVEALADNAESLREISQELGNQTRFFKK